MPTIYTVIRRPLITEKGLGVKETEGTLVFDVAPEASKTEVKQAVELLPDWQPMDIEDALELLSPHFQHPAVRRYAVSRLQQALDEVIETVVLMCSKFDCV